MEQTVDDVWQIADGDDRELWKLAHSNAHGCQYSSSFIYILIDRQNFRVSNSHGQRDHVNMAIPDATLFGGSVLRLYRMSYAVRSAFLKPVHTVAEKWQSATICRRKVSPNFAVVSPFSATVALCCVSLTFLRQCGQGFKSHPHWRQNVAGTKCRRETKYPRDNCRRQFVTAIFCLPATICRQCG